MGAPVEREAKLALPPGASLPPVEGVVADLVVEPPVEAELVAVYYDADDLRLARCGATVRHRTGEGSPRWTVKLPESSHQHGVLRRWEIDVADDASGSGPVPDRVPAAVLAPVRSRLGRAPLVAVARLDSHRRSRRLVRAGLPVGAIDDDEVTVRHPVTGAPEHVFREVEVEVAEGEPPEVLAGLVAALVTAGAQQPAPVAKVVRALGDRARQAPPLPDGSPAAAVVAADPAVRLGGDRDAAQAGAAAARALGGAALERLAEVLVAFADGDASAADTVRRLDEDWVLDLYEQLLDPSGADAGEAGSGRARPAGPTPGAAAP